MYTDINSGGIRSIPTYSSQRNVVTSLYLLYNP
nr:MAG TPA: hypothetical protein [Caudoviricetes sp.]